MAIQYILDTNILIAYVRLNRLYAYLEAQFALLTVSPAPLISVVVEGEIRAFAAENNWGLTKRQVMETLLSNLTVVPLPFGDVIERYVEISEFSRRSGRVLGKNDLWIAATATTTGATLLTTDKDFDHLDPLFLTRVWIDPASK